MDFIKTLLETIYEFVKSILKMSGVNVEELPEDLFPAE